MFPLVARTWKALVISFASLREFTIASECAGGLVTTLKFDNIVVDSEEVKAPTILTTPP